MVTLPRRIARAMVQKSNPDSELHEAREQNLRGRCQAVPKDVLIEIGALPFSALKMSMLAFKRVARTR